MKVLVVGVGAIGSAYLSFLTRAGHKAIGLLKKGKSLESIKVEGIWGEFETPVKTIESMSQLGFEPDVAIISVKSYDTDKTLQDIRLAVGKKTLIMTAQNGYGNYEKALSVFGEGKVILARVIFGSEVIKPGHIKITVSADDVVIGDPSGKIEDRFLENLADTFSQTGIPTRHEREVYKFLWEKIIYNCALNPLGALLETNYGNLAQNPHTKELMDRIINEVFEVIRHAGIETFWNNPKEYKEIFYEKLIPPTAAHYPSMLKDLKRGRTEIDALNGAICELGNKLGIKTPTNEFITKMIKAKELLNREA